MSEKSFHDAISNVDDIRWHTVGISDKDFETFELPRVEGVKKMEKITDIEANLPHEVAELICLNCHSRAIHVYPQSTLLKNLECKCGITGLLIQTGQTLEDE